MKDPFLKFIIAAFIAVILSLFISSDATAQESILSDTSYIAIRNDTVFQVKKVIYNTGRKFTDETPIGRDTSAALVEIRQQAYNISQQYATALWIVENEKSFRRTMAGFSAAINAIVGRTYHQELDRIGLGETLIGAYNFKINGSQQIAATIIRNPSGALRLRVNNVNYVIELLSELTFRVRNFDDGASKVDFYFVRPAVAGDKWIGGLGRYTLKKVNNR